MYCLIWGHVPQGQGSIGTFTGKRGASKYHFSCPSSTSLAGSMWELILTFSNYSASTTFHTPAFPGDLPPPNLSTPTYAPPKWL